MRICRLRIPPDCFEKMEKRELVLRHWGCLVFLVDWSSLVAFPCFLWVAAVDGWAAGYDSYDLLSA